MLTTETHGKTVTFYIDDAQIAQIDLHDAKIQLRSIESSNQKVDLVLSSSSGGLLFDPELGMSMVVKHVDLSNPGRLRSPSSSPLALQPTAICYLMVGDAYHITFRRLVGGHYVVLKIELPHGVQVSRDNHFRATNLKFTGEITISCHFAFIEPERVLAESAIHISQASSLDQAALQAEQASRQLSGLVKSAEEAYIRLYEQ